MASAAAVSNAAGYRRLLHLLGRRSCVEAALAPARPRPVGVPHLVDHVGKEYGAEEDQHGAQPVVEGEGIAEVDDGEQQGDELAQRDHQGDGQRGALRGQHIDGADAHVLGDHVAQQVEQHQGELPLDADGAQEGYGHRFGGQSDAKVLDDVAGHHQEPRQRQHVREEQSLVRMLAVSLVYHLLVDAHIGGHQQGDRQQANAHGPPEEVRVGRLDAQRVVRVVLDVAAGHQGAQNDARRDHGHRAVLAQVVALLQQYDAHDHVGHQRAAAEDHVQRHRNVEVEGVVVAHIGAEEQGHQDHIVLQGDLGLHREELGREDEALQGDEQELGEGDQVAGTGIDLDNELQEDDVAAASDEHEEHAQQGLYVDSHD